MYKIHYCKNDNGLITLCNSSNYWLKSEKNCFGTCLLLHTTTDKEKITCKKCLKLLSRGYNE
jgi:hypothetical protein